jgi:serine-type D-Ala-D-Ala carboxypeptidase (penicillin-binding protein 5/6)
MSLILPLVFKLMVPSYAEAPHPLRETSSQAACIIDSKTKKVLWSRDKDSMRYPASTTKIMTCLLMLENMKPDDMITAPGDVTKVRESSMNLKPYEKVRVKNMAYALMLRSANDGCYAIAVTMDGSVSAFSDRMNKRAKEIGCQNTHFENPNGLNNKDHKTSAFDLCLIAREALKRPDFSQVVRTQKKVIDRSINFQDRLMISRNKYLWKDSTADGVKTGYTNPSGHTYVGSATRDGTQFITSLMNTKHWMTDHEKMLKWAFENYETKLIRPAGPLEALVLGPDIQCSAELREDVYACVHKDKDKVEQRFVPLSGEHHYKAGDWIGNYEVSDRDGFVQKIKVYATSDEPSRTVLSSVAPSSLNTAGLAFFAVLGTVGAGTLIYRGILRAQTRA